MRRALLLSVVLPWFTLSSAPSVAQTAAPAPSAQAAPAMLVADRMFITPERTLVATGNVEAFQGDVRLTANSITYSQAEGTLHIEGPIRLDQGSSVTILADSAELDSSLRDGLLTGARMVFQQQLQMASLQMTRVGGRYTQLYKTAVTSCHVCEDGRPPLWQIRAERITHDQTEQQLYFENAQLRVLDVPVLYLPGMRLPDPNLKRATGFLIPSVRTTSNLGTGVKVPYFFKLGPHKDLTLAPYISSKTKTLDMRYRQAFKKGEIQIEGAYTRDDLQTNQDRGYTFATGTFDLRSDYQLGFDLKSVSDDAYLADYGLPDLDRLRSQVTLSRSTRDELFYTGLFHYKTLRDSEDQELIPSLVGDLFYQQRFFPGGIGGEARLSLQAHGHRRSSDTAGNALATNGRDQARITADLGWQRNWRMAGGVVAEWRVGTAVDAFSTYDDSFYNQKETRLTPRSSITFRLPMTRQVAAGATQFFEPIVQLGWAQVIGDAIPSDESRFVEFDQGNLLEISRFPAQDAREDGLTLVYGFNWAHYSSAGWRAHGTVGQVLRQDADPRFTKTSGLGGTSSDLLLAGQLKLNNEISLTARGLLNGSLNFSKAEVRGDWQNRRAAVSGTYLWLGTDPDEGRAEEASELWFDGSYDLTPSWKASANLRYDIADARATRAGVGFAYSNECVTVDLSVNRRYTSTTSVEPSTDFGFTIALNGFSVNSGNKKYRRSCRNI